MIWARLRSENALCDRYESHAPPTRSSLIDSWYGSIYGCHCYLQSLDFFDDHKILLFNFYCWYYSLQSPLSNQSKINNAAPTSQSNNIILPDIFTYLELEFIVSWIKLWLPNIQRKLSSILSNLLRIIWRCCTTISRSISCDLIFMERIILFWICSFFIFTKFYRKKGIVINRDIFGVIGHNYSNTTKAALEVYEEENLAVISATSTST